MASLILLMAVLGAVVTPGHANGQRPLRVVIVTPDSSDSRVADTRDALDFWKARFVEARLPAPWGKPKILTRSFDENLLQAYSNAVTGDRGPPPVANALTEIRGDILVFLSAREIISFSFPVGNSGRRVIGIRTAQSTPLDLPNVSRNVIAHELGHSLGLRHNGNPEFLMCGRPARCRPHLFQSEEPRFFPLTDREIAEIVRTYGV